MALGDFIINDDPDSRIYFRDELLLDEDSFYKPARRNNLEALAQTIQNLLIIEKGTYPNDPNLGVGIANYMFDLADNITITKIESEIKDQIVTYIAHQFVTVDVNVSTYKAKNTDARKAVNTLIVEVHLYGYNKDISARANDVQLAFAVSLNKSNKRVVSQLLY